MAASGEGDTDKGGQGRKGEGRGEALLTALTVDGVGSNGIVSAAIDDNNDQMALSAMASLTKSSDGDGGCHRQLCSSA